jgi:hypothetical protein
VTRRHCARPLAAKFATPLHQLLHPSPPAASQRRSSSATLYIDRLVIDMDEVMRPPALDELGLPLNRGDNEPVGDEMMQRFAAGDFSGFNLPQPSSFPTAAEAQKEA